MARVSSVLSQKSAGIDLATLDRLTVVMAIPSPKCLGQGIRASPKEYSSLI